MSEKIPLCLPSTKSNTAFFRWLRTWFIKRCAPIEIVLAVNMPGIDEAKPFCTPLLRTSCSTVSRDVERNRADAAFQTRDVRSGIVITGHQNQIRCRRNGENLTVGNAAVTDRRYKIYVNPPHHQIPDPSRVPWPIFRRRAI